MESEIINRDNIDEIWNYINSIDINIAKMFYLHFILDMPFKEIAKELDMKESTIKSSLYRMLKNIKNIYYGGVENEK